MKQEEEVEKEEKFQFSFLQKLYLSVYNFVLFLGWFHLLLIFFKNFLNIGIFKTLEIFFIENKQEILFLQIINLFDIFHAFIGLWPPSKSFQKKIFNPNF